MKILIADDHDLLRDSLVAFVEAAGGIQASTASNLDEVFEAIEANDRFDLVLLDYKMPGMNGLEGIKRTLALIDAPRVALISGEAGRSVAEAAIEVGAAGFIPKTLPAKSLVNAIRFMAAGEKFIPADYLTGQDEATQHPLAEKLTSREMEVLRGLAGGKPNKEIARDLSLSEPTVKLHVKNLYRKIGAANRTQAALIAQDAKLF